MNPYYHRARFLTSAAAISQAPADEGFEVLGESGEEAGLGSFVGRHAGLPVILASRIQDTGTGG